MYLFLEQSVLPFDSISLLNAYAKSHVQPFLAVEGDILFVCFVLSFGGNLFMSCRVFLTKNNNKKAVITKRGCLHLQLRALQQMKAAPSIQLPLLHHDL